MTIVFMCITDFKFRNLFVASFILLATLSLPASASFNLPDLGSSASNRISPQLAEQIGAAYIRQARAQQKFIEDPLLLNYLNTLGQKLVQSLDSNSQKFTFHLIEDDSLNAFAIPGGHIVIHTGLVQYCENEQQLAATLAHEIAHITQNHTARGIENSRYDSAITLASILLAAAAGSGEAAQAAIIAGQGSIAQRQLSYSRDFEVEADNEAIKTLYRAGYNPQALPDFLNIMNRQQQLDRRNPPKFLLTHPLTNDRIVQTGLRAKSYTYVEQNKVEELNFKNFKAIIEVQHHNRANSIIRRHQTQGNNLNQTDSFRLGLAYSKENKFNLADQQLRSLVEQYPNNLMYQVALAELESKRGRYQQATQIYDSIKLKSPHLHQDVALYHASTLITSRQNDQAIKILENHINRSPENPLAHILLARAYGELGLLLESYTARAEYHYLRGNLNFAIKQLDNAMRYTNNNFIKQDLRQKKSRFQRELRESEAALKKL